MLLPLQMLPTYLGRGRRRGRFALCLHLLTSTVDGEPVFIVMFGLAWEERWHDHDSTRGHQRTNIQLINVPINYG